MPALQHDLASAAGAIVELPQRKLQSSAVHPTGFFRFADALQQLAELDVGCMGWLHGQARLQVAARFAPQRLLHAQLPQNEQQNGVAGMLLQPALCPLQVATGIARQALDVEREQRRVPARLKALLDNLMRLANTAQRDEA